MCELSLSGLTVRTFELLKEIRRGVRQRSAKPIHRLIVLCGIDGNVVAVSVGWDAQIEHNILRSPLKQSGVIL